MKKRFVLLLLLLALLPFPIASAEFIFADQTTDDSVWTYPVPLEVFDDPMDVLRLINRENLLDRDYPDQSIEMYEMMPVSVPVTKGKHTLRPITNEALAALFDAAEADGIKLYLGSSYRNYRAQEVIHYNHVQKVGKDDGTKQLAGASEHQAGLAADVVSWKYRESFVTTFGDTIEGKWLADNCARFGFIIRYQKDKTDITGVIYEPWHLRYVGIEAASYIMESGLTLEEFTAEWQAALAAYKAAQ